MPLRCSGRVRWPGWPGGGAGVGGQGPAALRGPGQHPMPLKVEVASVQMAVQPII